MESRNFRLVMVFIVACAGVYLATYLGLYSSYTYNYDDFYFFARGRHVLSDPGSIFLQDYGSRYHPLYFLILGLEYALFELNPFGYGAVNLLFHAINAFVVYRIVVALSHSQTSALISCFIFAFSSTQWGVVPEGPQIWRLGVSSCVLGCSLMFIRFLKGGQVKHLIISVLLFLAAFGFGEDAVILPAMLFGLMFFWPRPEPFSKRKYFWLLPYILVNVLYIILNLKQGGVRDSPMSFGTHFLSTPMFFIKEYVHALFIPRIDFLSYPDLLPMAQRLVPIIIFTALWILILVRSKSTSRNVDMPFNVRIYAAMIFWFIFMIIPYCMIAKPVTEEAWPPARYLYLPSVPVCIFVGCLLGTCWRYAKGLAKEGLMSKQFKYIGIVGFVIFFFFLNIATIRVIVTKAHFDPDRVTALELEPMFNLTDQLRRKYRILPVNTTFVLLNSPVSQSRLTTLLAKYYGEVHAVRTELDGVVGKRIVMNWDGEKLREVKA